MKKRNRRREKEEQGRNTKVAREEGRNWDAEVI